MIEQIDKFADKVVSVIIKSSDMQIEVFKDRLRNNLTRVNLTIGNDEFVRTYYKINVSLEYLRKNHALLPLMKRELEQWAERFVQENGYKTTSPIKILFAGKSSESKSVDLESTFNAGKFKEAVMENLHTRCDYPLALTCVRIGRSIDNDIIIKDRLVSAHHALIEKGRDDWRVSDLNSRNGLFINYRQIMSTALRHGDVIQIGRVTFVFKVYN